MPKRYSQADKVQVLRLLEKNQFVKLRTEKMTGVKRQTIKVWEAQLGPSVFSGRSPMEEVIELVEEELKINDVKIIRAFYSLRKKGIYRLLSMIDYETNPLKIIEILNFVSKELQLMNSMNQEERPDNFSYLQLINSRLKESGYGLTEQDLGQLSVGSADSSS